VVGFFYKKNSSAICCDLYRCSSVGWSVRERKGGGGGREREWKKHRKIDRKKESEEERKKERQAERQTDR
jgi:hypothetical protein